MKSKQWQEIVDPGPAPSVLETGPVEAGSLKTVHKVFIAAASVMSLILIGWGSSSFRATASSDSLGVAVVGGALFVGLAVYGFRLGRMR